MSDGSFNGHPFTIVRRDVVFGVALYTIGYLGGGMKHFQHLLSNSMHHKQSKNLKREVK